MQEGIKKKIKEIKREVIKKRIEDICDFMWKMKIKKRSKKMGNEERNVEKKMMNRGQ